MTSPTERPSAPAPSEEETELAVRIEKADRIYLEYRVNISGPESEYRRLSGGEHAALVAVLRRPASHAGARAMREAAAKVADNYASQASTGVMQSMAESFWGKAAGKEIAKDIRAIPLPTSADGWRETPGRVHKIDYDGFEGTEIGSYITREGKPGVVLQQVGTKVVHVYGRNRLPAAPKGEK